MGAGRERRRCRLHRLGARAAALGHAPLAAGDARGLRARDRRCARNAGARIVLDIDYRPVLWGLTAPRPRRAALRRVGAGQPRSCSGSCRAASSSSAPRRRSASPAAAPTRHVALRRCARAHRRRAGAQARADGLPRFPGGSRRRPRQRHRRAGLSGRGLQRPRRRRRLHGRLPARLAARRAARALLAPTPTPAARSSSRVTAARRRCRAGSSCSTSSPTARASARCATTRDLEHLHRAIDAAAPVAGAGGARLRPPRRSSRSSPMAPRVAPRSGAQPTAPKQHASTSASPASSSCSPKAASAARPAQPGFGVIVDDRYGEEILPGADRRRRLDRAAGRAARLAAAALRGRRRHRAASARLAERARRQVPGQLSPGRRPALRDDAAAVAAGAAGGMRRHRPRAADRGDPAARADARRPRRSAARWRRSTPPACAPTGGSCRRRRAPPSGRTSVPASRESDPYLPRRSPARPGGERGRAGEELRARRAAPDLQGLRRRPLDLRRGRRGLVRGPQRRRGGDRRHRRPLRAD